MATAIVVVNAGSASAAAPHTVLAGETLWSIAAANNLTTRTVAAFNDLPENGLVVVGQTIQVPTVTEGAAALASASPAQPAASSPETLSSALETHQVAIGETLSLIAAVKGLSTSVLATANARASDSGVQAHETLQIPAASVSSGVTPADPTTVDSPPAASATGDATTAGLGHVPSPFGELHLDPAAAQTWNAMREESLRAFGQDLHPGGPLSAFRTYDQQAQLNAEFVSGQGPPAAVPGGSNHERGTSIDVATPEMRWVVDELGPSFGWRKVEAPSEWWHVTYAP